MHPRRSGRASTRAAAIVLAAAAMLAVLAVAAPAARAQSDVQLWLEGGLRHDLARRWTLTFDQHVRFDDDLGRVSAVMPEPGLTYRVKRWLRVGTSYRLQYERTGSGDFEVRHRFHLFARARAEITKSLRFDYRLQLQEQVRPADNDLYRHTIRNRAGLTYRGLDRWQPGADVELHHAIDDGDAIHLDKIWITVGVTRDLGRHDAEVFYRVELPRADTGDPTLHIIGLGFHAEV